MLTLKTKDTIEDTIETSIQPPMTETSEEHDGGHTPEYSVFALIGKFPNPFFGNEKAINELRNQLISGKIPECHKKDLGTDGLNQLTGLIYDENDRYNATILWAKTHKEPKEDKVQTYLFEDAAVYTVNALDRICSNTYSIVTISKFGDRFYTFLTHQDSERTAIEVQINSSPDETYRNFCALSDTFRGYWGHNQTGDTCVIPQAYTGTEPLIITVKIPFHNKHDAPMTGGFEIFEERDEETLKKLNMYDPKMLDFSYNLTWNLRHSMARKHPFGVLWGTDFRYIVHKSLFSGISAEMFEDIDVMKLPIHLRNYKPFKVD
jgi:hypothetical protein